MIDFEFSIRSIANIVYAIIVLAIGLLSLTGVYILLKHGDNRSFGLLLSTIYMALFAGVVISSVVAMFTN